MLTSLNFFASGTLERHDRRRIAFLPYQQDGDDYALCAEPPSGWAYIQYRRADALSEGAIVELERHEADGEAIWIDRHGNERSYAAISDSSEADRSDVLETVLQSDYAYNLIDTALSHWLEEREHFSEAQMLIVAPRIETAREYHAHVSAYGALLAVSTASTAHADIDRFRNGKANILITVGMAYIGLDAPRITHVVCLTNIRSRAWLEQCFDRANRVFAGKRKGHLFYPNDPVMRSLVAKMEIGEIAPAHKEPKHRDSGVLSGRKEGIEVIGSQMTAINHLPFAPTPIVLPVPICTYDDAEKWLRERVVEKARKKANGDTHQLSALYQYMRLKHGQPVAEADMVTLQRMAKDLHVDLRSMPVVGQPRPQSR